MAPLLDVQDLSVDIHTHRYGLLRAVHGVSFSMAPGEILGLVGESGAGKSLCATAVLGLLDPPVQRSARHIYFDGMRIDQCTPEAMRRIRGRGIGAIFQDPMGALDPLYTIGQQLVETITTHLDLNGAQARQRAITLLAQMQIAAPELRFNQYPHQLSGGMRQRVVIALALAAQPKLIVADEPTTALDVSVQAHIIRLLAQICHTNGTALLLITHDLGIIADIAHRVAVLYAGRIVECGKVSDVLNQPQHPYTQGLIGCVPGWTATERLTQIDGSMPELNALPSGCAFHPRCQQAIEPCTHQRPELISTHRGRVACWLAHPGGQAHG